MQNLRAAIRPDNQPQIYLPDRFRGDTTELEDGTIVMLDEYNRPVRMKDGRVSVGKGKPSQGVLDGDKGEAVVEVVEVKETLPELPGEEEVVVQAELVKEEELPHDTADGQTREELGGLQQQQDPDGEEQKPLSRAERRRLIKEEIQRLAQGEQPVYYQRRLW